VPVTSVPSKTGEHDVPVRRARPVFPAVLTRLPSGASRCRPGGASHLARSAPGDRA